MDKTDRIIEPEVSMLNNNKTEGFKFQERRHEDWRENYTLSRDKVITNRLIQRQSVNIPLMKTTKKTLLKDIDDMPVMFFENLDNDKQAEIFKNEYWKYTGEQNKFEILDIIDKSQMLTFGRTYDQWQIINGGVNMSIRDPMDILVSRYTESHNIHSSRYLIDQNIFVPLSKLEQNPDYDQEEIRELKTWYGTQMGLVKAQSNVAALQKKNEKLAEMGVADVENPILGETYVQLDLHFVWRNNEKGKDKDGEEIKLEEQIYLYVVAEDWKKLMKKSLEEVIDPNQNCKDHFWRSHYPYNSWADDIEKQDWYSDAILDTIRTPNKILNAFFSQLVENRALKNLNMNLYAQMDGWAPQTWEPRAWGMYGVPVPAGQKIEDVFMQLKVNDLSESLDEMNFLISLAEKASGATPTQQGVENERQITLGEVKLALTEAKERIKGMAKFYTQVWKERGLMFTKLIEAASDKLDAVKIYKKGRNSDTIYSREISPKDWMTPLGYRCKVWDQNEKNEQDAQAIEKINAVSTIMPGNIKLEEIKKRKLLEWLRLTPEEVNDVMEMEEQKVAMMGQGAIDPVTGQPMVAQPGLPAPGQQQQVI